MPLAEGVAAQVAYKFQATGAITPGSEPVPATDPGATGAQVLRRVSSGVTLGKDTYQSAEIRIDRQIGDFRHGTKRVQGSVGGELSALTYKDWFEAAMRGTWAAGVVALDETDFTSVLADNPTSTFTFAAGDPAALGVKVGTVVRFTNLSDVDNNAKNFVVTGLSGTSNRDMAVTPAPDTMSADTAFTMSTAGQTLILPSSAAVARLLAIEHYWEDIDIARLFTECRIAGANVALPATGMSTVEFPVMGRNSTNFSAGSAPFFTTPTAQTTTGIMAAVNGALRLGGSDVGVVTGLDFALNLTPNAEPVVGDDLVPEIFLGRGNLTGNLTALFQDVTFLDNFSDEDELELLVYLTADNTDAAEAMTFYMPRIKLGGADNPLQGESGQPITMPFQALRYEGVGPGINTTTLQIHDTEVT